MTDVVALANRLYKRIEWQTVPDEITREDLTEFIAEAIEHLYVMTGRSHLFSDDLFTKDDEMYLTFEDDLIADEKQYVLVTAEIIFFSKVQATYSDLVSYSTNAWSVTHGDKPFANLQTRLTDLESERTKIWYKMNRFHHLGGVSI